MLWAWPPNFSIIFLVIILLGISMLQWQYAAWMSHMRREYAGADGKFHVDRPAIDWKRAARNISLFVAGSSLIAFILKDQIGLSFWQIFFVLTGFTLTYQDIRFFGYPTAFIITASGVAIYFAPGHLDYRLFFTFKEIARIERAHYKTEKKWGFFGRVRDGSEGLLFTPKDINGFSKRLDKLFIVPQDIDGFLEQLPYGYK
ncbi:MAG TPA: hypothetical protein DCX53_00165 [Anaerolineae bacterium]|nr:hypothetical protein [Anaerolineae bacterium]